MYNDSIPLPISRQECERQARNCREAERVCRVTQYAEQWADMARIWEHAANNPKRNA